MSLAASIVAVAVMIARLLLKKAPKIFSYALWAFVLIRLLLPFSFTSRVSVLTVANPSVSERGGVQFVVPSANQPVSAVPRPVIKTGDPAANLSGTDINSETSVHGGQEPVSSGAALPQSGDPTGTEAMTSAPASPISPILQVGSVIWVIGMIAYAGLLIANSLTAPPPALCDAGQAEYLRMRGHQLTVYLWSDPSENLSADGSGFPPAQICADA